MTDRDAQPSRPFPHAAGARPVPLTRRLRREDNPLPDETETAVGKRAIAQIKKSLRQESA